MLTQEEFQLTNFIMQWTSCLRQNELHRPAGRNDGDPVYPEDVCQGILQYVYNSGILDHVDHDSAIGSVIGG